MTIVLNGAGLTLEKLVRIARYNEPVELAPEALERITICRAMLEEKLKAREVMYGTNTGIGRRTAGRTDQGRLLGQRYLRRLPQSRIQRLAGFAAFPASTLRTRFSIDCKKR